MEGIIAEEEIGIKQKAPLLRDFVGTDLEALEPI